MITRVMGRGFFKLKHRVPWKRIQPNALILQTHWSHRDSKENRLSDEDVKDVLSSLGNNAVRSLRVRDMPMFDA